MNKSRSLQWGCLAFLRNPGPQPAQGHGAGDPLPAPFLCEFIPWQVCQGWKRWENLESSRHTSSRGSDHVTQRPHKGFPSWADLRSKAMNRSETGNTKEALLIRSLPNTLVSPCGDVCCLAMHLAFLLVTDLRFHWVSLCLPILRCVSLTPLSVLELNPVWAFWILASVTTPGGARMPGLSPLLHGIPGLWRWTGTWPSPVRVNLGCLLGLAGDRLSFFAAGRDPGELMAAVMAIMGHLLRRELTWEIRRKRKPVLVPWANELPLLFQLGFLFLVTESYPARHTLREVQISYPFGIWDVYCIGRNPTLAAWTQ